MSIRRTIIQTLPLPQLPGWESRLVLLEYPPGCAAPVHTHPVAATGYILQGTCHSQWEGGELEIYSTGDGFTDHGERVHVKSVNVSDKEELKMLVSYVIKTGQLNVEMK